MRRQELRALLPSVPIQAKRTLQTLNNELGDGLIGSAGHRDYTDRDVRLLREWQRVIDLTGLALEPEGVVLRRRATRMLAAAPCGYVWISQGRVGWSLGPPLHTMRQGAATWPVSTGLD